MKKILLTTFVLATTASFGRSMIRPVQEAVLVKDVQQTGNLMPVIGPSRRAIRTAITFQALSSGCTRASDFNVKVARNTAFQQITIERTKPDTCESVARRESFEVEIIALAPVHQLPIQITNPLLVDTKFVY